MKLNCCVFIKSLSWYSSIIKVNSRSRCMAPCNTNGLGFKYNNNNPQLEMYTLLLLKMYKALLKYKME